jgi:transcriptional regulator with XRE-family HTH domain
MDSVDTALVEHAHGLLEQEREMMAALREIRKRQGLSQAVVAQRMGVTQPAVAAFESYDANPTMGSIRRYALAVGAQLRIEVTEA